MKNKIKHLVIQCYCIWSDELERLEKQLEGEEAKYRRLEEDHNRSKQERSHLSATEDDLRKREKNYSSRIEELERELETKNDLVCTVL